MSAALIGFLDDRVPSGVSVDALTNKIGGDPVIYGGRSVLLLCKLCKKQKSSLVCQLYCPVDDAHHRTLYIFCCPASACHRTSLGWQVLRLQQPISTITTSETQKTTADVSADIDWGTEGADDWGASEDVDDWLSADPHTLPLNSNETANKTAEESVIAQTVTNIDIDELLFAVDGLSLKSDDCENTYVYDSHYISVHEDNHTTSTFKLSNHEKELLEEYDKEGELLQTRKGGATKSVTGEHYEKSAVAHGDSIFYKFTKHVSVSPTQIIRYDYGGRAVPMRSIDTSSISVCQNCGGQRVFEAQLMPALLQSLSIRGKRIPLDVGTVIIYSCGKNCWAGKISLEYPIVQHDPDAHLFKKKT